MPESKLDITGIVEQHLCHSCGSCFASCGHDCISYKSSVGGYYFPEIDYDKCTSCTLCYDVCPGDHFKEPLKDQTTNDPFVGEMLSLSVGKATDNTIFKNSQSGGAVTAILKYLLDSGQIAAAVVTEMDMSSPSYSKAKIVTSAKDLIKAQKSKYVPTTINALIPEIMKIEGNVALVGLSCHMHGLENLLTIKKKLKNKIIRIGLICESVMTQTSVKYFSQGLQTEKIRNFVFKDKLENGYPGDMAVVSDSSKKIIHRRHRLLMKDFFTPARCRLCFDKMNIYADIVVGDPHGITGIDRKNGESLVIGRTPDGERIIKETIEADHLVLRVADRDEAIAGQRIDQKRKAWNAYINAWEKLGHDLPDYPKHVYSYSHPASLHEIEHAQKSLEHSLALDDFTSEKSLLKAAQRHHRKLLVKKAFNKITNKLRRNR